MSKPVLGIIGNTTKDKVKVEVPEFLNWLESLDISFVVASDLESLFKLNKWETALPEKLGELCDFVLSFGGDGTFLQTARLIAPHETPIIGINLGEFGYLAEIKISDLQQKVRELLNGDYIIKKRMMLQATAPETSLAVNYYGLNDIVVDRGGSARIIRLDTRIDGEYLNSFNADGLIAATPTGSTGYSLSAGGPILEPSLDGIIINPISPHMLANRPLVVSDDRTVEIVTYSNAGVYQVSVDGQQKWQLASGEKIIIKKAPFRTKVVVFKDFEFYRLLRNKLHWKTELRNMPAGKENNGTV